MQQNQYVLVCVMIVPFKQVRKWLFQIFFPVFNIFVMLLASTTVLDFLPIALEKKRIKSTYSLNTQNRNSKYIPKNSKAIQSFHFAVLHQCCTLQHFYFLSLAVKIPPDVCPPSFASCRLPPRHLPPNISHLPPAICPPS